MFGSRVLLVVLSVPMAAATVRAEPITLLCDGRTIMRQAGTPDTKKTWDAEALIFDLDSKRVLHGSEDQGPPIVKATPNSIAWKDNRDGIETQGEFSRVSLSGKEVLQRGSLFITNYYDTCKPARARF